MPKPCIVDGCPRPSRARQRCNTHYHDWRRKHLNVAQGHGDDRLGFCKRLADLLNDAPGGMLTDADRALMTAVAYTAAIGARGIVPITPATRRDLLHTAVDALDTPGAAQAVAG